MAKYIEIQTFVKEKYGYIPKTCWIAHAKKLCGLKIRKASNCVSTNERINPCPAEKLESIKNAFAHFGMIKKD